MAKLSFKTLSFLEKGNQLQVSLLQLFVMEIPLAELEKIAPFKVTDLHTLGFGKIERRKAEIKFSFLLEKYLPSLKNKLTENKSSYLHRNSGIPLIGNVAFGIVYRNSSIIEIKPITSCNLNCIYCSVSEGLESRKNDFVVEKDYLVEELKKLIGFISEPVEVHVGVQGEPFLYSDLDELVADLQKVKEVTKISIDTNGTLLSPEKIVQLAQNPKLQLNFSLDALDEKLARKISGVDNYNVQHVQEMISLACEKGIKVIVAPVFIPGINDGEIEKIIAWIKGIKKQPILGLQNFLPYKTGKIPVKPWDWERFYSRLEELEKKHQIQLRWSKEDFQVRNTKELPKPFQKGDIVPAILKCSDRFPNSAIAAAKGRSISIPNCRLEKEKAVKVKIVRDKHNIFVGKLV